MSEITNDLNIKPVAPYAALLRQIILYLIAVVASLAAVGILMNVSRQSEMSKKEKGRLFGAVVDLRGRDRGRRVPRARRMAGTR